jgi:UDP-N-acetylmuramoyl-L-alanyl-D-glutamate--2,6-diaminopimelate ligase
MSDHVDQAELDAIARGLTTIAVTGTNGKTSTTTMIASVVRAAGETPVRVSTLGMWVGDEQLASDTSMASFARTVRRARELGARTLALEVTSRALEAGFAARWPAHVAVFTNLTRDHLDRHGTPERYLAAKAQLFVRLRPNGVAVLNACDPASDLLAEVLPPGARCVGFRGRASGSAASHVPLELAVAACAGDAQGLQLELAASPLSTKLGGGLALHVLGHFQAENAAAAAVAAHAAGYSGASIRRGLEQFEGVPGRFEPYCREPLVVVDFAHTPDALTRALESARELVRGEGRLACVFGCGGERDDGKRPQMGEIADRLADCVWLTSDNPRGERPASIAAMVRAGARGRALWHELPDRRAAIAAAVTWAAPHDVVLIAGRGAETEQQVEAGRTVPFADADIVREVLATCGKTPDS